MQSDKQSGSTSANATPAPAWAQSMRRFNDWCMFDLGPGPKALKLATIINLQKGGCFLFFGALMYGYAEQTPAATSTAAWIYLAMHGSYGLVWLLKDYAFPDGNWHRPCTYGSALFGMLGLAAYWTIGWLLISGTSQPDYPLPEPAWFTVCISLCVLGSAIMIAADAQKYVTLKLQRGLITGGMFRYVRHPNYLGEMMIYASFGLMAWHWLVLVILGYYWLGMFAVNMAIKEASMSRYPEWAAYKRRSWWLLPFVY